MLAARGWIESATRNKVRYSPLGIATLAARGLFGVATLAARGWIEPATRNKLRYSSLKIPSAGIGHNVRVVSANSDGGSSGFVGHSGSTARHRTAVRGHLLGRAGNGVVVD